MDDETQDDGFDVAEGEDGETYLIEEGECIAIIREEAQDVAR